MSQPRVPKCYPKGFIPPCWSPKPTPCPSPVSPGVTLKVSFHHAGPLNPPHVPTCPLTPPHVPAPCPHLSPKPTPCPSPVSPSVTLKVSFHHAGPLNPPHVPAPCPQLSPKPTPCPSPVSPSVTLKVSFHHAGYSSLKHNIRTGGSADPICVVLSDAFWF